MQKMHNRHICLDFHNKHISRKDDIVKIKKVNKIVKVGSSFTTLGIYVKEMDPWTF